MKKINYAEGEMMRTISRVSALLLAVTAPAIAQTDKAEQPRSFAISVALGPTHAFRGVDSPGIQGQGGLEYKFTPSFGLRVEGTGHWYEQQPVYPCLIQDAFRCYQTVRRAVSAGVVSATYHISRFATDKGRAVPYLISGVGVYKSRRIATHYPDCQPSGACTDRSTYKLEFRDTQVGVNGGLGLDFQLGPVPTFAEMRIHYVYPDTPRGQPSNDYFLWPLSVGLRF
jgi:hypothetical protein